MSQYNISKELVDGEPLDYPSTTPVRVINVANTSGYDGKACIFGYVNGAPGTYAVASDGFTSHFQEGCIMIDTSNAKPYSNKGTLTAPSWTVLS